MYCMVGIVGGCVANMVFVDNPPTLITMLCASVGLDDIAAVFRREYAHLDNISSVKFVLVNSIMYHIFEEMSMLGISPELLVEYKAHAELCKANVDTGLANLPLLLSSTAQNVQGLLLGVRCHFLSAFLCRSNLFAPTDLNTKNRPLSPSTSRGRPWPGSCARRPRSCASPRASRA